MDDTCPFCVKLAALDTLKPGEVVWSFPHSVAFLGTWQFYEGYCVLVSRRHATELSQLAESERAGFLEEMCLTARAIEQAFRPHKMNYELLGNQVPHLHWHLFPRLLADPDHLKPVWLALDAAERDPVSRKSLEGTGDRASKSRTLQETLRSLGAPTA
jgi:diadenosine tetraphosphate (Ap4A) HIT family hydrolase